MTLEWVCSNLLDCNGKPVKLHYLIDPTSQRCYATIPVPTDGYLIYATEIRVSGNDLDRSYMTLEAAKDYCESVAWECDKDEEKKLTDYVKELTAETKERTLIS